MASEPHDTTGEEERSLRSHAMQQACICPGIGAAHVGQSMLAWFSYGSSLLLLTCLVWLSLAPTQASLGATLASLVAATMLWLLELVSVRLRPVRSGLHHLLARSWTPMILMAAAALGAIVLTFQSFGSLVMAGNGMSPLLNKDERLLYYKWPDQQSLRPGTLVLYRNPPDSQWGQPGWIITGRILAGPGDAIASEDGHYVVNGQKQTAIGSTTNQRLAITIAPTPQSTTVPAGCYFIVQDNPTGAFDSQVLSWAKQKDVLSTQLWRVNTKAFLEPIH